MNSPTSARKRAPVMRTAKPDNWNGKRQEKPETVIYEILITDIFEGGHSAFWSSDTFSEPRQLFTESITPLILTQLYLIALRCSLPAA